MNVQIRPVQAPDAEQICHIYNHYILNTTISFEYTTVSAAEMGQRIEQLQAAKLPWLVLETNVGIQAYAYASPWKARYAYRFAVESSVYVAVNAGGQGFGRLLYTNLMTKLRVLDMHTVIAVVALPNPASVAFHEKMGFQQAALFHEVGWKFDRWIDVGYWQLRL